MYIYVLNTVIRGLDRSHHVTAILVYVPHMEKRGMS